MLAFYDTETTGFTKPNGELSEQPHCVQLAILLTDLEGNELESFEAIIKPEPEIEHLAFTVPDRVAEIHGISTDRAILEGISLIEAIERFDAIVCKASVLIAHNIDFDRVVMAGAYWRAKGAGAKVVAGYPTMLPHHCTMKSATNIVRMPKSRGTGFKWPKLIETHLFLFNEGFEDAHSAMADVRACKRVYFGLKEKGAFRD